MTGKKDEPGKDTPKPADASQAKRPFATLDLKATEVTPPKDAAKDQKPASPPPASAGATASAVPNAGAKPTDVKPGDAKPVAAGSATDKKPDPQKVAETKATATPPKPQPEKKSGGGFGSFLSHMAAGIGGGFLALLGADMIMPQLDAMGIKVPAGKVAETTAVLEKRLAALEGGAKAPLAAPPEIAQKLAAAETRLAKLDELQKSLASVSGEQAKLANESKSLADKLAKSEAGDGAQQRLAKLEEQLKTIAAAAGTDPQKGGIPQIAAVTGKIADIETNLANQVAALRQAIGQQIEARVGLIAESSEAAKVGTTRIDRELASLKSESVTASQRMAAAKAETDRIGATLRAVQDDTAILKNSLDALKGDVDARIKTLARPADVSAAVAPVAGKLTAIEQNLQSVVKSEEDRRANAERIVLSLELGNLKRAMDRGQKYATELAEVKKMAGGKLDLAVLERFKDQGVPTLVELQREFRPVIGAMMEADAEPAEGSVMDRLIAGAQSVVKVRKASYSPDDKSAAAIATRMEVALKEGRPADAVEEAKKLSPKAQDAAKSWLPKVEARAAVDRALAGIEGQLKSSLGAAPAAASAQPAQTK